ncbi:zinc finger protein 782-like [Chrysoperla carnea]|uniref:zinc finger protein 782-like n=1 Tax=Chrysoperla carnea TaxID=189513 RepID=UPI001D080D0F|nr:zinc finger protein 782-like [Chrysoperla carnea]
MDNCLSLYCRLCAEIKSNTDLIDTVNHDLDLKRKIYDLLAIEISDDIDLPKSICNECSNKVVLCSEFKEQSQKAQTALREIFLLNKVKIELSVIDENIDQKDDSYNDTYDDFSTVNENSNSAVVGPKEDVTVKKEIKIECSETDVSKKSNLKKERKRSSKENRAVVVKKERLNREVSKNYHWQCTDCDDTIKSAKHYRRHCAEVHNKLPEYVCSICSKHYQHERFDAFYKHIYRHLNEHQYRPEVKHICPQCGKLFKSASNLRRHSMLHLPKENRELFTCLTCDKKFPTKSSLKYHTTIHTGQQVLIYCEQCGKSFKNKSNLTLHIKTQHSEEKPYHCEQCSKRFKSIPNLHKHLKVHLGLKLKCNICGKLFSNKSSLKRHSSTHSGLLPFECSFCNKRFRLRQFLKNHIRQHTSETIIMPTM